MKMSPKSMKSILAQMEVDSLFVIDQKFAKSDYVPLDLSRENKDLADVNVSSSKDLGIFVKDEIKKQNGKLAFGGYLETRDIYQRSTYFNAQVDPADERNIHLGIDVWIDAGTDVLAVLDGEVHSFNNNMNHGDYGPTIILKHELEAFTFYSLYGHLSLESLTGLKRGRKFAKGERIAQLGNAEVNGDYPPHLHFQLMLDMEDFEGDYPGVCSLNSLEFYRANCPDPNLLLGLKR